MVRYLTFVVLLAVAASNSSGAIKYWDINGATAGAGGAAPAGTWDATGATNTWSANSNGTGAPIPWVNGSDAVFAAGSDATGNYGVTLTGTPIVASLTVEEGSIAIGGSASGTLDFGTTAGAPISVAAGATFTEFGLAKFIGTGGLVKTGAGTLTLEGTNTFSKSGGGDQAYLTIADGVVGFSFDANLGDFPNSGNATALTLNGGTLRLDQSSSPPITLASTRGVFIGANGGTFDIPNAATLALPSSAIETAALSGAGTITKTGVGRLSLNRTQTTFTGKYVVKGGSVAFDSEGTFGAVPATPVADYFLLDGGGLVASSTIAPVLDYRRGITLGPNGGFLAAPLQGFTYDSVIAGTQGGGLTIKLNDAVGTNVQGTVRLGGANTYSGTTQIDLSASLIVGNLTDGGVASGLGTSSSAAGNLVLNGGTLGVNSSAPSSTNRQFTLTANGGTIANFGSGPVTFSSTGSVAMSGIGSRTLTLQVSNALNTQDNIFALQFGNAGSGPNTLRVTSGTWLITNTANNYTGDTTLNFGELKLGASGVIPDASRLNFTTSSCTFNLNGFDETVRTLVNTAGTFGTVQLGSNTLTLGNPTGETFSGGITGNGGRLVKSGSGSMTVTGQQTYTGDTIVQAGTLSINTRYLANGADVLLTTGAVFNLNFSGMDTIDSLFFDGMSQATGTWGGLSSTASHKSSFFTGNGLLMVTTQASGVSGDFNNNGVVDAADYSVWRKNNNTYNALPNDNGLGAPVNSSHYALWRANFGRPPGSGSVNAEAVPEAGGIVLILIGLLMTSAGRVARTVR